MKSNLLQRIRLKPCLWFDHQAEEAVHFYTSIFENSKTGNISRYGESGSQVSGQKKGSVMAVDFELDGQNFTALNGGPIFKFSPSISFFIACDSESKMDQLWSELSTGGSVLWELKKYPWAEKYGWCQDRFGVYWQIVPENLGQLMSGSEPAQSEKIMKALLQMKKINIDGLKKAHD